MMGLALCGFIPLLGPTQRAAAETLPHSESEFEAQQNGDPNHTAITGQRSTGCKVLYISTKPGSKADELPCNGFFVADRKDGGKEFSFYGLKAAITFYNAIPPAMTPSKYSIFGLLIKDYEGTPHEMLLKARGTCDYLPGQQLACSTNDGKLKFQATISG